MAQSQAQKPEIRRKEGISNVRTPDRDKVAEVIEDMWPATLKEIVQETEERGLGAKGEGYSMSHVHNVLDLYFERYSEYEEEIPEEEPVAEQPDMNSSNNEIGIDIVDQREIVEIPEDIDTPDELLAYLRGWGQGFIQAKNQFEEEQE